TQPGVPTLCLHSAQEARPRLLATGITTTSTRLDSISQRQEVSSCVTRTRTGRPTFRRSLLDQRTVHQSLAIGITTVLTPSAFTTRRPGRGSCLTDSPEGLRISSSRLDRLAHLRRWEVIGTASRNEVGEKAEARATGRGSPP